jgi:FkbM family methyltransferase
MSVVRAHVGEPNMYKIKYHNIEVCGIIPTEQGWLWPEHDNCIIHFSDTVPKYFDVYKEHLGKGKVAVQAGGHFGMHPRVLSKLFETVYTFEPDSYSFHCLVNNCQIDNIKKFNCVLSDTHDLSYQQYDGQYNRGVNFYGLPIEGVTPTTMVRDIVDVDKPALVNIPQLRIDDLNLSSCDLIHLDVEGSEDRVLKGAINTLQKFKPVIILESLNAEGHELIYSLGYGKIFATIGDTVFVAT